MIFSTDQRTQQAFLLISLKMDEKLEKFIIYMKKQRFLTNLAEHKKISVESVESVEKICFSLVRSYSTDYIFLF